MHVYFLHLLCLSSPYYQATQLTHVLYGRLKKLAEDVEREKALKDVAEDTAKEKGKVAAIAKKRAQSAEKAQLAAEKRLAEMEAKLGGVKLKLVEAESLTLAQAEEITDLKAALDASEEKGYTMKASQMLKILWSLLSSKLGIVGLARGGWQRCKQWEWQRIPH